MIGVGDHVPDVDLALADGSNVRLAEFIKRGPVVLFFYPRDGTPGCTAEACSFRDAYAAFTDAGTQVIGVSSDSAASHSAFRDKHGLPFPLASDATGSLRAAFGVPKALGVLPGRVTYVIGRDGVVSAVVNSMFAPQKHVEAALTALKSLA